MLTAFSGIRVETAIETVDPKPYTLKTSTQRRAKLGSQPDENTNCFRKDVCGGHRRKGLRGIYKGCMGLGIRAGLGLVSRN